MKLKYVGPRAQISHSSITFDMTKEDKFVYINIALQLLKALEHEYNDTQAHIYNIDTPRLSVSQMESMVTAINPDIDKEIEKHHQILEKRFEEELKRAKESETLDDISKEILIKNYKIMRDYRLQRDTNKSVYYMVINKLSDIIVKNHIKYITTPMYEKFIYVLNSILDSLTHRHNIVETPTIDIFEESGELKATLKVL